MIAPCLAKSYTLTVPIPIIGVTPKGFNGITVDHGPDIRIPIEDGVPEFVSSPHDAYVNIIARLRSASHPPKLNKR